MQRNSKFNIKTGQQHSKEFTNVQEYTGYFKLFSNFNKNILLGGKV